MESVYFYVRAIIADEIELAALGFRTMFKNCSIPHARYRGRHPPTAQYEVP